MKQVQDCITEAAENGGPMMFARIVACRAALVTKVVARVCPRTLYQRYRETAFGRSFLFTGTRPAL
jgi:hypothetical protein